MDPRDFFDKIFDESSDKQSDNSFSDVSDDFSPETNQVAEGIPQADILFLPTQMKNKRNTDLVIVIDPTEITSRFINVLKSTAANFIDLLDEECKKLVEYDLLGNVRVRVIICRDYSNTDVPMRTSRFFTLSNDADKQAFISFVNSIDPISSKNELESVFEALCEAFHSPWTCEPAPKRRRIVVMISDASVKSSDEPKRYGINSNVNLLSQQGDLEEKLRALHVCWMNDLIIDQIGKRLLIFAPDSDPWHEFAVYDYSLGLPITYLLDGDKADIIELFFSEIARALRFS